MNAINPKVIRQLFIILLILLMSSLIFKEMLPYLSGVLGAITFYVLLRKPMSKLVKRGWNPDLAVSLLLIASVIGILIPVGGIAMMLASKIENTVAHSEEAIKASKEQLGTWEDKIGYDITSKIDASAFSNWLSENLQSFAGGTFNILIALGLMYFMLYYMLTNRRQLRESLYEYIPIGNDNLKVIGKDVQTMVRSNALGIPLVALAQGIVALIGFLIFNIEQPFFWSIVVFIGSMIPFVGTFIGTLPVFILTLSSGNDFQAWGILIYGIVIIGSTDNLLRLFILKKIDNVHPLITLLGVIVGVPLFGFIGLIFGPLLISLFLIVLRIYKEEYGQEVHNKEQL
ncbi:MULTISPECIES: AI-2E family transporter [Cellulophaga]|jgi:predicted PurR-regulated permease PerM|uniref:Predicted PurR-regulated permease PerM n=2 Tax=Cellulophaga baltica TaxID=76594 RepID=A0A1G7DCA8_9FLAO|nr:MULTISPECIES: AI-2E family transporter [Cellulophaga]AIY12891.1 transmembrane protein [Cellulophaga baltica NN016038]AIZ41259.1 transmembrane protein [Cellulophaga baltica 18]KGK32110.1 transmembrane protein [Cellulophaga sp. E6(2014)]MCR1023454.1 AI-2E family transporter [Cellulophaga baltica]SDE49153.1 Predicted PurR-regulated permease PerM [Cellulophaga baltica]